MTGGGIFWIASYPKSGNTWVRCIIASLLNGGRTADLASLSRVCPNAASRWWIEEMLSLPTEDLTPAELTRLRVSAYRAMAAQVTSPRCLKVHDRYDPALFPPDATKGIVYIVRDPRDVAPSWADHMDVSLDTAIQRMGLADFAVSRNAMALTPQAAQIMGSWSGHVESWLGGAPKPLLLLRYEDMLADPHHAIARLAAFLGVPDDPATVAGAAEANRFEALQAAEAENGFAERLPNQERFFRQGRAGAWQRALSAQQAARLLADHGATMARLGYGPDGATCSPKSPPA